MVVSTCLQTNLIGHPIEGRMAYGAEETSEHHVSPTSFYSGQQTKPLDVEQIMDTFLSKDGSRYYKIRWKDSWEREDCLVSCGRLIKEFWENIKEEQKRQLYYKSKLPTYGEEKNVKEGQHHEEQQEHQQELTPSPSTSSAGRRKGRPKKLVNHSSSSSEEIPDETKQTIVEKTEIKDINDNIEILQKEECFNAENYAEKHDMIHEKRCIAEEFPVMIIKDHEKDLNVAKTENYQLTSPYRKRSTSEHSLHQESHLNYRDGPQAKLYRFDYSHLSRSGSILPPNKHETSFYSNPSVDRERISPVFSNSHVKTIPVSSLPSVYPVIRSREGYSEHVPILYDSRHSMNDAERNAQYIVRDPQLISQEVKYRPKTRSSPDTDTKLQTSQLLLKVKPDSNHENQFPYQAAIPVQTSTIKHTKDHIKPKLTKITHKLVDGEQRPQCMECFQTFKKRAALERHMMIHRGIKPFQCHFCNQRFRQKHHLQGHIMLHTGERPHSCSLCNKKFRMRHHLLEHERISHKVFR